MNTEATKSPVSPNFSPVELSEYHSTFKYSVSLLKYMLDHILHNTSRSLVQKLLCCHNRLRRANSLLIRKRHGIKTSFARSEHKYLIPLRLQQPRLW